jgi:hypothetical protein
MGRHGHANNRTTRQPLQPASGGIRWGFVETLEQRLLLTYFATLNTNGVTQLWNPSITDGGAVIYSANFPGGALTVTNRSIGSARLDPLGVPSPYTHHDWRVGVSDDGSVAFGGRDGQGRLGVFAVKDGVVRRLVDAESTTPRLTSIGAVFALADDGAVTFAAGIGGGDGKVFTARGQALTEFEGTNYPVTGGTPVPPAEIGLRAGDAVGGVTITQVVSAKRNAAGQMIIEAKVGNSPMLIRGNPEPPPDIRVEPPRWADDGGIEFTYHVIGGELAEPTEAELFWYDADTTQTKLMLALRLDGTETPPEGRIARVIPDDLLRAPDPPEGADQVRVEVGFGDYNREPEGENNAAAVQIEEYLRGSIPRIVTGPNRAYVTMDFIPPGGIEVAKKVLGVEEFNWLQTMEFKDAELEVWHDTEVVWEIDEEGNPRERFLIREQDGRYYWEQKGSEVERVIPDIVLDPLPNTGRNSMYAFRPRGTQRWIPIDHLTADAKPFYWDDFDDDSDYDLKWHVNDVRLRFVDVPLLPSGRYEFFTKLAGETRSGEIKTWDGVGVNVHWTFNGSRVTGVSRTYSLIDGEEGGWVSDVLLDADETVRATDGSDIITIRLDPSGERVQVCIDPAETPVLERMRGGIRHLTVEGLGGDDVLIIDRSNGDPLPGGVAYFDGGDGQDRGRVLAGESNDQITLAEYQVRLDDTLVAEFANVEEMELDGGAGDDHLRVERWNDSPPIGLAFRGGAGENRLTLGPGKHTIIEDLGAGGAKTAVTALPQAVARLAQSQTVTSLTLRDDATLELAPGGVTHLVVSGPSPVSLAVGPGARLDISDNSMTVRSTPAAAPVLLGEVSALIASARNAGATPWSAPGVTSSAAADRPGTTLGVRIIDGDIQVKYTQNGDANLDREVNFADLVALAQNYNATGRVFAEGNFDFSPDGKVDFTDLVLLAQRYGAALAASASRALATAPPALSPPWSGGPARAVYDDDESHSSGPGNHREGTSASPPPVPPLSVAKRPAARRPAPRTASVLLSLP